MNAPFPAAIALPAIGAPFEGGYFAGRILVGGQAYALIVAPKASGEIEDIRWNNSLTAITDARSFSDGAANTRAMAAADSTLAERALAAEINGFSDWYLPARDELEILYRAFKPTGARNYCWSGDNPSSIPVGYAYSPENPARTDATDFVEGGPQSLERRWYWSSTQYAGGGSSAWCQGFSVGVQINARRHHELPARLVRRLTI